MGAVSMSPNIGFGVGTHEVIASFLGPRLVRFSEFQYQLGVTLVRPWSVVYISHLLLSFSRLFLQNNAPKTQSRRPRSRPAIRQRGPSQGTVLSTCLLGSSLTSMTFNRRGARPPQRPRKVVHKVVLRPVLRELVFFLFYSPHGLLFLWTQRLTSVAVEDDQLTSVAGRLEPAVLTFVAFGAVHSVDVAM